MSRNSKEFEAIKGRGVLIEKVEGDVYTGDDAAYNGTTFIYAYPFMNHDGTESDTYHSGYYTQDTVREIIEHLAECAGLEITIGDADELDAALRDL